ncbi:hypothetical protein BJV77DRAFT_539433 [Russula vinacea]|nr:hypothetical protein BJV77DRAFT_539433 [Russula vinacea]
MSLPRVTTLLASLFFFSAFAVAEVSAPSCTRSAYQWTFNSLGQSPCTVAAYMIATCNGGDFTLSPLNEGGEYNANTTFASCECTTVAYSLLSACGVCQGESWFDWLEWADQCTTTPPPSTFPNPVPSRIRVPQWALFDVTLENDWDPSTAYAVGDFPEIGPGAIIGPAGVSTPPMSSSTATGLPISGAADQKQAP